MKNIKTGDKVFYQDREIEVYCHMIYFNESWCLFKEEDLEGLKKEQEYALFSFVDKEDWFNRISGKEEEEKCKISPKLKYGDRVQWVRDCNIELSLIQQIEDKMREEIGL